jgi:hypothetical protein
VPQELVGKYGKSLSCDVWTCPVNEISGGSEIERNHKGVHVQSSCRGTFRVLERALAWSKETEGHTKVWCQGRL